MRLAHLARVAAMALLVLSAVPVSAGAGVTAEVITLVRVHGNVITAEAEVLALVDVPVGTPFEAAILDRVRDRLTSTGRFDGIQVLKRFESIDDPTRVVLVILLDEKPSRVRPATVPGGEPRLVPRRGFRNLMFVPILGAEDGYGLTYGVQFAVVEVGGQQGRFQAPLSWGGTRQAGITYDRIFAGRGLTRLQVGGILTRRVNPAYDVGDGRRRAFLRAERRAGPVLLSGTVDTQHVGFGRVSTRVSSTSLDAAFDTRLDPVLARNAVLLRAAWTRSWLAGDGLTTRRAIDRSRVEARGYLGTYGQTVLVARVAHERAGAPLPPYLKSLLGGWDTVRGVRAGAYAGDNLLAGSLEWRVPVGSPLRRAQTGVSMFVDRGVIFDAGTSMRGQPIHHGMGGSVWLSATVFRAAIAVARESQGRTRLTFSAGTGF